MVPRMIVPPPPVPPPQPPTPSATVAAPAMANAPRPRIRLIKYPSLAPLRTTTPKGRYISRATTNNYPEWTILNPPRRGRSATGGVQDGALGHRGRQVLGWREGDRRGASQVAQAR